MGEYLLWGNIFIFPKKYAGGRQIEEDESVLLLYYFSLHI